MNQQQKDTIKDGFAMTLLVTLTTIVAKKAVQKVASPFVEEVPLTQQEQVNVDYKDAVAWACITGIASGFLGLALRKYKLSLRGDIV